MPTHRAVKHGRPFKTYTKQLTEDCEYEFEDLHNTMSDREVWRSHVKYGLGNKSDMMMMHPF